jgi:ferredoxin
VVRREEMPRRLHIVIDYDRCVGSSICVLTAPGTFALNDDRQSTVIDPTGDVEEKVLEAAEGCPMAAIIVEDADTGERLFPPP